MSNIYGNPWTGMQVTVIGGEIALWTHVWSEFEAIWPNNPLQTVASPGTATPTTLISKISRFIGWAMFNATPSTRTEWQAWPLQSDALGNLLISLATRLAGEDIARGIMKMQREYQPYTITTAGSYTVRTGPGLIGSIIIQWGAAGTIKVYDNTSATGTPVLDFDSTSVIAQFQPDLKFYIGCFVVTSANTKVTFGIGV